MHTLNSQELQTLKAKIGKKLKELRAVNSLTQEQVSERLEICRNTYSDIEMGKVDLCLSRLLQLASFYHVSMDYLMNDNSKVVFYLNGNNNTQATNIIEKQFNKFQGDVTELKSQYEIEKLQLYIESKEKEIELKDNAISNLKEMIELLKQQ